MCIFMTNIQHLPTELTKITFREIMSGSCVIGLVSGGEQPGLNPLPLGNEPY